MKQNMFALVLILLLNFGIAAQIIDVHLHSYTEADYWGGRNHPTGISSPKTAKEHLAKTIEAMNKNNIQYAVVSGSMDSLEMYAKADPRFIPGYMDSGKMMPVAEFEKFVKEGKIKVFGEITAVYNGTTLNDPMYAPYLKICEKYGIPVAYHTGGGPPMTPFNCCPKFRLSFGDPLLIEDVLVKYPKLKVYLMHAGEVYFEHALRMMALYRNLYVDVGVILWIDPIVQDYAHRFLKQAKNAGLLDRVMFGTDNMVWPGSTAKSLAYLNSLEFLTPNDKKKILYFNATTTAKAEQKTGQLRMDH
jgi:predicted TIM-barrel fold metal-dependent hydrolase